MWAALTEPESLGRWLGEREWAGMGGRVREVEPERLLELDWRAPGEETSLVRFELSADGDGTLLVLDHRLIEEPLGMAYIRTWMGHLGHLESLLEGHRR